MTYCFLTLAYRLAHRLRSLVRHLLRPAVPQWGLMMCLLAATPNAWAQTGAEWKALKGETGTRPLDTEAAAFATTYSEKLHRMSGVTSDGVTITDIKFHKSQKRFTIVTELSVFSLDAMDKSDLDELESALKEIGSEMVNEMGKRNPIIKRCMEAGYNFEFQYLDQDQKELCTLHLTPEDYNN